MLTNNPLIARPISGIAAVSISFNVFSYDVVLVEDRTHNLKHVRKQFILQILELFLSKMYNFTNKNRRPLVCYFKLSITLMKAVVFMGALLIWSIFKDLVGYTQEPGFLPAGARIRRKLLKKYKKTRFIRLDQNLIIDKYTTNNANFFADIGA